MKLLIVFPTRGRRDKFFTTLDTYYSTLSDISSIHFHISLDDDDIEMNRDDVREKLNGYLNLTYTYGEHLDKIPKFNRDIHSVSYAWDIVIATADDMIPIVKGWDDRIRSDMLSYYKDLDGALFYDDGLQHSKINTLPIMGRTYFNRFNYIWYPGYKSLRCDVEYTEVGFYLGKLKYIPEVIIEHRHPIKDKSKQDYVHVNNHKHWPLDLALYNERKKNNFGLGSLEWLTEEAYMKLTDDYWKPLRWEYMSKVIEWGKELNPLSVLELGTYGLSLCKASETMDIHKDKYTPTYLHDATIIPWPVNRKYDLFIALQVFEHLDNKQKDIFTELKKLCKYVIISIPYKWKGDSKSHDGLDERTLMEWSNKQPIKKHIVGKGNKSRMIALYKLEELK